MVIGAVGTDHADDGQDQIARRYAVVQLSGQIEAERLRNHDPGAAGHHAVEIIGASYARTESAQSAVCASVAVSAKNQLAGDHVILAHDLVTYAGALIEGDVVLSGKIPHLLLRSRCLGAVAGDIVVDDPDQLVLVRNPGILKFIVHINRQMGRTVVAHQIVECDGVDLAGVYSAYACRASDDLFSNCHSHVIPPLSKRTERHYMLSREEMSPPWSRIF